MNRPSMPLLVAVLAAIAVPAVTLPAGAFAQSTVPTTSPIVAPGTTTPSASVETELPKSVLAKVDQHIKQLHDQLRITPAQQPQWEQFAAVMRDNAAQMAQAFAARGTRLVAMNATDNMQSYAQLAQVHATNMQKLASAFQSLYETFPDQQKQVADGVFQHNNGRPIAHKR
jgi:periplasmic protein CpxP/Spy